MKRREHKFQLDTDSKCTASQKGIQQEDDNGDITEQQEDSTEQYEGESSVDLSQVSPAEVSDDEQVMEKDDGKLMEHEQQNDDGQVVMHNKDVNTDVDSVSWDKMQKMLASQRDLIELLSFNLKQYQLSPAEKLKDDDERTHFYTGLPSYALFDSLCTLLSSVFKNPSVNHGLTCQDQFLLVLMKLRLGDPNKHLAYTFGITPGRVSQLFHEWIDVMSRELQSLIVWPDRQMIRKHLPESFKPMYAKATCIIDCSEVFIERATSLSARSETYSNYKSHNTAKFLVAISPTGAIIFISKCWGGRASDKTITTKCGLLDHINHDDLVLADRGFDITEDLGLRGASLAIPAFTKGKSQLSQREVETSRAPDPC